MWCISIGHCLGAATGSLEICTQVIPMPESHYLKLPKENFVWNSPPDDKNVVMSGIQKLSPQQKM